MAPSNFDDLDDKLVQIDWEKRNGYWDYRVKNYMFRKVIASIIMVALIYGGILLISSKKDKEVAKTWDVIKKNENLYVTNNFVTDSAFKTLSFSRKIRPITTADIDAMKLSVAQRRKMLAELDTTKTENALLDQSDVAILKDNVFKYGTALAGTLVEKDSTTKVYESVTSVKAYGIRPNKQLLDHGYKFQVPKGYVLANDIYYVNAGDLSLTEPEVMKKFKSKAAGVATNPVVAKKVSSADKVSETKKKTGKRKKRTHHVIS